MSMSQNPTTTIGAPGGAAVGGLTAGTINDRRERSDGRACRQTDGRWQVAR